MTSIVKLTDGNTLNDSVFIAPNASVIGDVSLDEDVGIWYNCVIRGDVNKIIIGRSSNIQDATVIHVDREYGNTEIGNSVTVGHSCLLHACTLSDNCFVGMGSIIMDRAYIEEYGMLAAGSLLTRHKVIGKRELWAGRPAKFVRHLSDTEVEDIKESAVAYVEFAKKHRSYYLVQ